MTTWWRFVPAVSIVLFVSASVEAGVYSTLEPRWTLSADYFTNFQAESLIPLKQLATPEARSPWQKSYELAADGLLVAKDPPWQIDLQNLPFDQRLNLAVCLLRVRRPGTGMQERAIVILRDLLKKDKENFLVMSTLATAYLMTGDYRNANTLFSESSRFWSKPFDKLTVDQQSFLKDKLQWKEKDFEWFAKCEKYQRQLGKLRQKELVNGPLTFDKATKRVDALFDPDPAPQGYKPLRFVGESGTFKPGKIAAAESAKLPPDAIEIVEQLLIWTPDDLRLYWLLGELLNAKGDVAYATIVVNDFLSKFAQMEASKGFQNINPKTGLPEIDVPSYLPKLIEKHPEVGSRLKVLLDYVPQAPIEVTGPGTDSKTDPSPPSTPKPDEPQGPGVSLNLDWQTLSVGLGVGALVGFLVSWRLRDILRRRHLR